MEDLEEWFECEYGGCPFWPNCSDCGMNPIYNMHDLKLDESPTEDDSSFC